MGVLVLANDKKLRGELSISLGNGAIEDPKSVAVQPDGALLIEEKGGDLMLLPPNGWRLRCIPKK